jgi:hypothetical protein
MRPNDKSRILAKMKMKVAERIWIQNGHSELARALEARNVSNEVFENPSTNVRRSLHARIPRFSEKGGGAILCASFASSRKPASV